MLRKLNLVLALLAIMLASYAIPQSVNAQIDVPPGFCCGMKPSSFPDRPGNAATPAQTYSAFTGQIAIVTGQLLGGSSVVVVDLKNENTGIPLDTNWAAQRYRLPEWATTQIGDVFGLTLDSQGNVYVTATTSYFTKAPVTTALPGVVYRIDGATGAVNKFATLPNKGPALGNINYSCLHDSFYVSNFADGRIYQIKKTTSTSTTGTVKSTFDHQTGTIVTGGSAGNDEAGTDYTKFSLKNPTNSHNRGGRVWGVAVFGDRLYYGVWRQDSGEHAAPDNVPNEVWSIKLNPNGSFTGSPQLEITLPTLQSTNPPSAKTFSNPVSSITFNAAGDMLVAERSMNGDSNNKNGNYAAHASRYLEYSRFSSTWTLQFPTKFGPGTLTASGQPSSAGGADYDSFGARVWGTADAMHLAVGDYIYGIQGLPISGGNVHNSILTDLTDSMATLDKNQMGDIEIPCPACVTTPVPTPTPTAADCCDKIAAVPFPQPNVSIDYRTITITNLKAPVSPICSVDISMTPTPAPGWQGGDLYIDGTLVPTATRFIYPYTRVPNKPAGSSISAVNTVTFNLGVDYTLGWTGTVTFVVHHCDGSICTLTYGPWTATPPQTIPGIQAFDANVSQEGRLYTLGLQLKQRKWKGVIKWISFRVGDDKGQIFAASTPSRGEGRPLVENGGLSNTSVLFTFGQPLKSGQAAGTFNLVVRRGSNAPDTPLVIWTTYDANGNALETGTITGSVSR